ncbi:uncharacterized protein EI90DRAFT_3031446 [Cantharellus anzutake]|uniref:uncharacterized protein n=1 Tax=Cantharellus anzutake TaxID=1750568 RepID=UPI001905F193|nr:uncharacterized protein EI90DRAFT_3031446 [Cantharellus anzutake]KAF8343131.1 hypothetical protein EI90DRAFT_3031446 [Cantharellus anzutake]
MEQVMLWTESGATSVDTADSYVATDSGLDSILRARNMTDWLECPPVEYTELNDILFRDSFSSPRARIASRIRSPVVYDNLPSELNTLRRGFEQEELRSLPRSASYGSLLALNLNLAFATSYYKAEKIEIIHGDGSNGLNNPNSPGWPSLDASNLGTMWTLDSNNNMLINQIFRGWHRRENFTDFGKKFLVPGFALVDSISHFSSIFCIGGTQIPVGVAVDMASRRPEICQQEPYQQADVIARQELIKASLPVLTLMAMASCHIDAGGNLVRQPFPEAFVFGIAVLTEEVLVELLAPYFDEKSKNWKIYCSSCHSIVLGDPTLARARPHFLFVRFLNLISGIHVHHQNVVHTLARHEWDEHVLAVFSKPSSAN